MKAFDDVRLPVDVEQGAEGGPVFSTGIVTMANGQEQRIQNWAVSRNTYTISYGTSDTDWQAVRAFFYARRGRARGFRFKDWTDFIGKRELPTNNNGVLTITRTYQDDIGIQYVRNVTRIVPGTLKLYDDNGSDFTAAYKESFGLLTLLNNAGAQGSPYPPNLVGKLYADYEYDIPVRFDVDEMIMTAETIIAASIDKLTIIELIESSASLNGQ